MKSSPPPLTSSSNPLWADTREATVVDVLAGQARTRVLLASVLGIITLGLQMLGVLGGNERGVIAATAGYIVAVRILAMVVRRTRQAGDVVIGATVFSDLAFVFATTIASSSDAHYYRILILSFFVLNVAESFFGGRYATIGLMAVVVGYLAVTGGGGPVHIENLWTIALFAATALMLITQYSRFQRHLEHIVELFEWAEDGDFSHAYEVNPEKNPATITRVGRAYNRVRIKLASMVLTDPLTGCLNRRGLDQALAREIARASRAGSNLALLALDLDHFKEINDTYGHIAGDVVLRQVGALLAQTARAGDMVARTGGEEFTVILPDTDADGAYHSGVRICDTVRTHAFMVNGKRLHLTISVGIVSSTAIGGDAVGTNLKEHADEALYTAKRAGRDRVSVWDESLPLTLTPIHTMVVPAKSRL
ncbi:MAG TPA: diguanylate cyclase [Gemmatimonadaceae bacterium]|nr:diguanylate cyclase [Gemmatimonadaceae bacterium]